MDNSSGDLPETSLDEKIGRLAASTKKTCGKDAVDRRSMDALVHISTRWQTPRAPVVVAGEVSVGKSRLINALIGEPLLPIDQRAWTSTWTRVHYSPTFSAIAAVEANGKLTRLSITRDELDLYLTIEGIAAVQRLHGRAAQVSYVEIGVPVPLLQDGLELIDTPGVGGLRAAHRQTALAGLTNADAVIFVSKPGTPLSASERLFLAEAIERVAACVVVFTIRDQLAAPDAAAETDMAPLTSPMEWEALGLDAESAANLAERFGSVRGVSVSSPSRLAAAAATPGPGRDKMEAASNMTVLENILRNDVVARIGTIHRQNVVQLCWLLNNSHARNARQRVSLLRGDAEAQAAHEQYEQTLAKWTSHGGDYWRKTFDAECGGLPEKFANLAKERTRELKREYRVSLQSMSVSDIQVAVAEIRDAPADALTDMMAVGRKTIDRAVARVQKLLQDSDLSSPLDALSKAKQVERALTPDEFSAGTIEPGIVEARAALTGGMAGIGGAAALGASGVFLPFAIGAAIFSAYQFWQRRRRNNALKAIEYLDEVCEHITKDAVSIATKAAQEAAKNVRAEIAAGLHDLEKQVEEDRQILEEANRLANSPAQREERIKELLDSALEAETLRTAAEQITRELR